MNLLIKNEIKLINFSRITCCRDVTVLTLLDTCTSLIAGFTVFGILGNLAYESGINDISKVIKEGSDLAFISYPDAISKFPVYPQVIFKLIFLLIFNTN